MWSPSLRVMLIAVICVRVLSGIPSSMPRFVQKRETEQRYCGSKLYYKLRQVCNSTYQEMENKKKRDIHTVLWFQSQGEKEVPNTKFPFRARSVANKFSRSFRRQERNSRGVADECCINKGCTLGELTQYCAER